MEYLPSLGEVHPRALMLRFPTRRLLYDCACAFYELWKDYLKVSLLFQIFLLSIDSLVSQIFGPSSSDGEFNHSISLASFKVTPSS
jgi:hypothetical protein